MATARLENRARELQRSSDRLWKKYAQGDPLQADEFEALAEVSFRLAVHPQTETATAFTLLYRAHKLDGTNPKYAYHLGRLYLVHGQLDRAAEWLTTAAELCPTSHRIWSHLSIVQRALDERYHGRSEYEASALRKRAEQIALAVRKGDDSIPFTLADVVPPPSLASLDPKAIRRIGAIREEQGAWRAAEIQREAERLARKEGARVVGENHLNLAEAAIRKQSALADGTGPQPRPAENVRSDVTTVPRVTNPGRCRWSGIYDLEVDIRYGAETSPWKLLPEIEDIRRLATARRGGAAAFAVLSVEWLVCGYPPETIRRLSKRLPASDRAVLELLDRACELFEVDESELPHRLAECLERETLPPMLVALVHHRRLLWRPLRFPDLGAYRAAMGFMANPPTSDGEADYAPPSAAADHVAALEAAIGKLRRPAPRPMAEPEAVARPVALDAAEALARLAELEQAKETIEQVQDETMTYLQRVLSPVAKSVSNQETFARVAADHRSMCELADRLQKAAHAGLEGISWLLTGVAELASQEVDYELKARADDCRTALAELAGTENMTDVLYRVEQSLNAMRGEFQDEEHQPSDQARELLERAERAGITSATESHETAPTQLVTLDRSAGELATRLDEAWERLVAIAGRVDSGKPDPADALACDEIARFVDETEQRTKQALASLAQLRETGRVENPETLAALEAAYKDFNTRPARFRRRLRRLDRSLPHDSGAAVEAVAGSAPATGGSDVDKVAAALERAKQAMDENIALARKTFDSYDPATTRTGPLLALRTLVAGRQAETLYRMGRAREAKRIWYRMLTEDRLNLATLKNLAVTHTCTGEVAQATQAWQSYLETLYFLDIVAGSPRPHADKRARVHSVCAAAYGTQSLLGGAPKEDEDLSDIPEFLSRRAPVAAFADHRRLEGLNRWLGYRSPTLILGVSRSNDEEALTRARDRQVAFLRDACRLLPSRIRMAFSDLSIAHVELAYRESLDVKRRTLKRERYYKDEEQAHLEWIKETIFFKVRIRNAIHDHTDWAVSGASGDVVGNLLHVDAIRLDPADDLVCRTAESIGIPNPEEYLEQCNDLVDLACNVALRRIFDEAAADADSLATRFQGIVDSWGRNEIPDEYVDVLDDPQTLYLGSVGPAFEAVSASRTALDSHARRTVEEAIEILQRWTRRLPRTTGPARALAQLLAATGRLDEASAILEEAQENGFSDRGRLSCAVLLAPIAVQRGDIEAGLHMVRELIGRTPGSRDLLVVLHNAYMAWLNASDREGPSPAAIAADFDRWMAGVEDGDSAAELRAEAVASKRTLIVQATVGACRDRSGAVDWRRLAGDLRAIRGEDPENEEALYYEMQALQNGLVAVNRELSSAIGQQRQKLDTESRGLLAELRSTAEALLQVSYNQERRAQAESVVEALRGHGRD